MRKLMLGMLLAAGAALPTLAATAAAETGTTQDRPQEGERHPGGPGGGRQHDQAARPDQPRPAPQAQPQQQARPQPPAQAQTQAQAQVRADGRGDRARWGGGDGVRADAAVRGNDGGRFGGGVRVQADERARFGTGDQRRFDDANRQSPPGVRPDRGPPAAAFGNNRPAPPPAQQQGFRGAQGNPGGYRANGSGQDGYRADAYGRAPQYRPGPGAQNQYRGGGNWNRGWRDDRRYDWGGYRAQNRSAFHLQRYSAPAGWNYGYRRFSPGLTLFAGLFDEQFWLDDAYDYRLPPAYGPYRWVRYYNDALLVDVRTGYVVDTVYDIFW